MRLSRVWKTGLGALPHARGYLEGLGLAAFLHKMQAEVGKDYTNSK